MHNVQIVHRLQALDHLDKHPPNKVLLQPFIVLIGLRDGGALPLETLHDLPVQVAHVHQLHDDAQGFTGLVDKCFFITDDVLVFNTS